MNSPQSRICGNTNAGMNCTAWNSVRANALARRPSAIPSTALATASTTTSHARAAGVEAEQPERDARDEQRLDARRAARMRCRSRARRSGFASGIVISRSSVPGRALAQHRDRGDEEHRDEREQPEKRARRSARRRLRLVVEDVLAGASRAATGTTSRSAIVRGSRRSCVKDPERGRHVTSSSSPSLLDRGSGSRPRDPRPRFGEQVFRRLGREEPPLAHEQELVAVRRLVHDVAGDQKRRSAAASSRNIAQRSRRSTGSSPTVGSSRTSSSGPPSSAVASETRARCPPESRPTTRFRSAPANRSR